MITKEQKSLVLSRNRAHIRGLFSREPQLAIDLLMYAANKDVVSFAMAVECLPNQLVNHPRFRKRLVEEVALKSSVHALTALLNSSHRILNVPVYRLADSRPLQDHFSDTLVTLINEGAFEKARIMIHRRSLPDLALHPFICDLEPFCAALNARQAGLATEIASKRFVPAAELEENIKLALLIQEPVLDTQFINAALQLLSIDHTFDLLLHHATLPVNVIEAIKIIIQPAIPAKVIELITAKKQSQLAILVEATTADSDQSEEYLTAAVLANEPEILKSVLKIANLDWYFKRGKILNLIARIDSPSLFDVLEKTPLFTPTRQKLVAVRNSRLTPAWMKLRVKSWRSPGN